MKGKTEMKVYQKIAAEIARLNRAKSDGSIASLMTGGNPWESDARAELADIESDHLPNGSGFDCGTRIIIDESSDSRIVLATDFHHMNENGYYDGWTTHRVILTPSFQFGFEIRVTGKDRNGIKEYIGDAFHSALNSEIEN